MIKTLPFIPIWLFFYYSVTPSKVDKGED